jgi:SAM-dependent methyltransferase
MAGPICGDLTKGATAAMLSLEVNMSADPIQDQRLLREEAYVDDSRLDVRTRTHQLYTLEPVDFVQWTLDRLSWRGDERVLDVGCGPGDLLCRMARDRSGWGSLTGSDPSPGMIAQANTAAEGLPVRFFVSDAQALPCPDGSFDVVMARHMLYHVPDIDRAVAESARVLDRGGHFLAVTNSAHTMPEYRDLRKRAASRFPAVHPPGVDAGRFALENGEAFLAPYFDHIEMHTLPGVLCFPGAGPLVDYFASARTLLMKPGHRDAEWEAVLGFVRAEAEAVIGQRGHFDITKLAGAIVGVKGS